ncbi:unnamed protein product [Acanthosepion pharaonis]|uniref:Uncharacterized protein n=1 Tax=Acanthosepion pharaonis TaxID=158019 RepID=A0A812D5I8_ACAPH|nr:unnamed protein product [Sepia pharaonis]
MAAKMESERLCFIQNHQKQLRSDSYVHLRDSLRNEVNPRILPSIYTRVTCMNARRLYKPSETVQTTNSQEQLSLLPHLHSLPTLQTSVKFVSHCYYIAPDKHFLPPAFGVFAWLFAFSVKPSRLLPLSSPLHHYHLRCGGINNCKRPPPPPGQMHR